MATLALLLWLLAYQRRQYRARRRYVGGHRSGASVGATLGIAALRPASATLAAWQGHAPIMTRAAMLRAV